MSCYQESLYGNNLVDDEVKLHKVISGKSKGVWGVPPRPGFSFARGLNLSFSNVQVCLLLLYSAAFKSKLQVLEVGDDLYSY